jgi:hypothetical protein
MIERKKLFFALKEDKEQDNGLRWITMNGAKFQVDADDNLVGDVGSDIRSSYAIEKAKTKTPNYYEISGGDEDFKEFDINKGFEGYQKMRKHVRDHAHEFGIDKTKPEANNEYINKAKKFLREPLGDNGDMFTAVDDGIKKVFKFDPTTNEFCVAGADGMLMSYYIPKFSALENRPDAAKEFWQRQKDKHIKEGYLMARQLVRPGVVTCSVCCAEVDSHDICDVCGWHDDSIQEDYPNETGANHISLNEARKVWESGKAIKKGYPRKPVNG